MTRQEQNEQTVMAFYDLMFNQCEPAEAIRRYVRRGAGHSVSAPGEIDVA